MRPLAVASRPADRIAESVEVLERRGFSALVAPLLEPSERDGPAFAAFARDLVANRVDVVVFTSPYGLRFAAALAARHGVEEFLDLLRARHVAAIGPRTAEALRAGGLRPGLVATEHTSGGLARDLAARVAGRRVALLRSARGDPRLATDLAASGADVLDVPVYDLEEAEEGESHRAVVAAVREGRVAAYLFTSPLTAERLLDLFEREGVLAAFRESLSRAVVAAIGPPTAEALARRDVRAIVAEEATFPALVEAAARAAGLAASR